MVKVSVLLPVRNAVATLQAAVGGVLPELGPSDELVAVDDRSTDGSGALLQQLARADARIRAVPGPGRGISAALNAGLAHCRGAFISRMDADDESLPGRIRASVYALECTPSLAAVGTQVEIFRDDQPVSPNMRAYEAWMNGLTDSARLFHDRLVESPLCHPAATVRAGLLRTLGGYADDGLPEDYGLWLELLSAGHALVNLPRVLFRWRDSGGRLTRTDPRYAPAAHLGLKARHLSRVPAIRSTGRCALLGAGKTGLGLCRALRALGVETAFF
ncbi:MAG: glycosyltransferase, partial [Deltaproteobacteria bacterium]|nr:glycosyltransferase [Deltaproteobacteria bacterium]